MVAHLSIVLSVKAVIPKKILNFKNTKVIALDRDKESEKIATQIKENFEDRFIFKNIKFSQLNKFKA